MIRQCRPECTAADFLPQARDLNSLRRAAESCRGCGLFRLATQTVFGDGPVDAQLVFASEQPGSEEDESGRPFVGPAAKLFDAALEDAGIDRQSVYVTYAVKHFKSALHDGERVPIKPSAGEIRACRPWLEAELKAIRPAVLVCLGAAAAQSLLGPAFRVSKQHGQIHPTEWSPCTLATYHPAAILRAPDAIRADVQQAFYADIRIVAEQLATIDRRRALPSRQAMARANSNEMFA